MRRSLTIAAAVLAAASLLFCLHACGEKDEVVCTDADQDGYLLEDGCAQPLDCDDTDPALNQDDADGDGYTTCGGDCDDDPAGGAAIHPGAAEACGDGFDNDCAGGTDCNDPACASSPACLGCIDADADGHYAVTLSCYGGDDCDDADSTVNPGVDADGDGLSACEDCDDGDDTVGDGLAEACDAVDNDCDGEVDEGDPGGGAPCDGADRDLCEECAWTCAGGVLVCSDATGDEEDVCDGADNDCDPASADGSEDPLAGDPCDGADADLCLEGSSVCLGGAMVCSDATGGAVELCDGADNDCDPLTEDGVGDPQLGTACDGADGDRCAEGTRACEGGALACSEAPGDALDVCDGADNDCNPLTPDGSGDPQAGEACDGADADLCLEGNRICTGGALACSDVTASTFDICNGVDDDCDAASADGSEDPQAGIPCDGPDADLCQEGNRICTGGALACSDATGSAVEVCDDADNDCDGTVDEGDVYASVCLSSCSGDGDCAAGHYCEASACVPRLEIGEPCAADGACVSGHCTDAVCCESACLDPCASCGVSGSLGSCLFVADGEDPYGECADAMVCDGAGACRDP